MADPSPHLRVSITLSDTDLDVDGEESASEWGFGEEDADSEFDFHAALRKRKSPSAAVAAVNKAAQLTALTNSLTLSSSSSLESPHPRSILSVSSALPRSLSRFRRSDADEAAELMRDIEKRHQRAMTITQLDDGDGPQGSGVGRGKLWGPSATAKKHIVHNRPGASSSTLTKPLHHSNPVSLPLPHSSTGHSSAAKRSDSQSSTATTEMADDGGEDEDWDREIGLEEEAALPSLPAVTSPPSTTLPNTNNAAAVTNPSLSLSSSPSPAPAPPANTGNGGGVYLHRVSNCAANRSQSIDRDAKQLGLNISYMQRLSLPLLYGEIHAFFRSLVIRISNVLSLFSSAPQQSYSLWLEGLIENNKISKTDSLKVDFMKNIMKIKQELDDIKKASDGRMLLKIPSPRATPLSAPPSPSTSASAPSNQSLTHSDSSILPQSTGSPPSSSSLSSRTFLPNLPSLGVSIHSIPPPSNSSVLCSLLPHCPFLLHRYQRLSYFRDIFYMMALGFMHAQTDPASSPPIPPRHHQSASMALPAPTTGSGGGRERTPSVGSVIVASHSQTQPSSPSHSSSAPNLNGSSAGVWSAVNASSLGSCSPSHLPAVHHHPSHRLSALPTTNSNLEGLRVLNLILQGIDYLVDCEGKPKSQGARLSLAFQRLANTLIDKFNIEEEKWKL